VIARDKGEFGGLVGLEKTFAFNLSGHVLHTMERRHRPLRRRPRRLTSR
jgi:hypothetical protein